MPSVADCLTERPALCAAGPSALVCDSAAKFVLKRPKAQSKRARNSRSRFIFVLDGLGNKGSSRVSCERVHQRPPPL